jgi:hypothetical protein
MKMFKKLLFVCLALASVNVFAQTADDIVAKHIEAMGGAAKLASLNSAKMTGSLSVQGTDVAMTITRAQSKGVRMDMEIMGTSNYQLANNEKGFAFMPIMGMSEPKEMEADQLNSMKGQFDVQGPLFNYKEKGTKVEYIGTEKVDGADAYNLKLTYASGNVSNYFVDTKTNRILKNTGKAKGPDGSEVNVETSYSDYKQNADGYWFAYTNTTMQGTIVFDKIETNVKIDESIFKN